MAEKTGTDILRETLRTRNRKYHIGHIARDLGISSLALEAFAADEAKLPPDVLKALARDLFPHSDFDPELDALRPAMQEPARLLGIPPQLEMTLPRYAPGPGQGPRPVIDAAVAQPKKRAGWIGGWL